MAKRTCGLRRVLSVLCTLLLVLLPAAPAFGSDPLIPTFTVRVKTVDASGYQFYVGGQLVDTTSGAAYGYDPADRPGDLVTFKNVPYGTYRYEFYMHTYIVGSPTSFVVDGDIAEMEVRLSGNLWVISGYAEDSTGARLAYKQVLVDGPGSLQGDGTTTGPDGSFTLRLPDGTYKLLIGSSSAPDAVADLSVSGGNVSNVVARPETTVPAGYSVRVRTVDAGGYQFYVGGQLVDTTTGATFGYDPSDRADGRVAFKNVPAGTYRYEFYMTTYVVGSPSQFTVAGDIADMEVQLAGYLYNVSGFAYDQAGSPLVGQSVLVLGPGSLQGDGTTTAADGSFTLKLPNGDYTVRIGPPDAPIASQSVTVNGADVTGLAVQPPPAVGTGSISGLVTGGSANTPLAGAILSLSASGTTTVTATTDTYGAYSFENVAAGTYTLFASAESHVSWSSEVTVTEGGNTQQNFSLPTTLIGATAKKPDGTPAPGRTVHLLNQFGQSVATAVSDAEGVVKFPNLAPGDYGLLFNDAGYAKVEFWGLTLTPGDLIWQEFVAEPGYQVRGSMVDVNGKAFYASPYLMRTSDGRYVGRDVSLDNHSTGAFGFTGVPDGTYTLHYINPYYLVSTPQTVTVSGADVTGLQAQLSVPVNNVHGVAVDAAGNRLANLTVSYEVPATRTGFGWSTAADGTFTVTDLAPGTYMVRVGDFSSPVAGGEVTVGNTPLKGALVGPGTLTGTVRDGSSGLGGATVTLSDRHGRTVASTATAADGSYSFTNIFSGEYDLTVSASGFPANVRVVAIPPAATAYADVVLQSQTPPMVSIAGAPIAFTASTLPVISGTASSPTGTTVTVEVGGATYTTLISAGVWSVTPTQALAPGPYAVTARVTESDQTVTAVQVLNVEALTVSGTAAAQRAPGLPVHVALYAGTDLVGQTDTLHQNGSFTLTAPGAGDYTLKISRTGWQGVAIPISLTGGTVTLDEVHLLFGDLNSDGAITEQDLAIYLSFYESSGSLPYPEWDVANADSLIDLYDLFVLAWNVTEPVR